MYQHVCTRGPWSAPGVVNSSHIRPSSHCMFQQGRIPPCALNAGLSPYKNQSRARKPCCWVSKPSSMRCCPGQPHGQCQQIDTLLQPHIGQAGWDTSVKACPPSYTVSLAMRILSTSEGLPDEGTGSHRCLLVCAQALGGLVANRGWATTVAHRTSQPPSCHDSSAAGSLRSGTR